MNCKIALAAGLMTLGLTSFSANAAHIGGFTLFDGQEFTFNPDGFETSIASTFTASAIDFSYTADVDQTNTGAFSASFVETGVAFFSAFQHPLGTPVLGTALNLGFGLGYKMYGVFTATGSVVPGPGFVGIDGTFDTFNLTIYIDRDENTTSVAAAPGDPNQTTAVGGTTTDDIAILSGVLTIGGFHVSGGLLGGDFDVLFRVTSYDPTVWGGAAFAGDLNNDGDFDDEGEWFTSGDLNGVNTGISGLVGGPFATKNDIIINGSGNIAFNNVPVPVPGVLGLLGAGLLGLGWVNGRARKNA
ncbi:flocculation-associated PEP-CTERM protein PepA [Immundisolibacter sp.]|uniref:flocculation-associated PEP-CTERM protein PepA n=1 Tax=Immundisolibacter sp. TaxID=1934948 RepID=UPI0035680A6F